MNDKEKKAFVARMKKGKKDAAKGKKKKSKGGLQQTKKFLMKYGTPAAKAEMIRVNLLLDDYKSGRNWKSDPPRSKIEKSGTLAGWLSYAKKFRISTTQAKKIWR